MAGAAQVLTKWGSPIQTKFAAFCQYGLQLATSIEPTGARMKKARKLYESSSGDRWYLIRDPSGAVFIHHEANG